MRISVRKISKETREEEGKRAKRHSPCGILKSLSRRVLRDGVSHVYRRFEFSRALAELERIARALHVSWLIWGWKQSRWIYVSIAQINCCNKVAEITRGHSSQLERRIEAHRLFSAYYLFFPWVFWIFFVGLRTCYLISIVSIFCMLNKFSACNQYLWYISGHDVIKESNS